MTATLTERSEGTAAHKGFNPKRKLENRDRAAVIGVKSNATIVGARGTVRNNVLALAHFSRRRAGSFGTISLYAVRPL